MPDPKFRQGRRRRMEKFNLVEISGVDRPAQAGASAVIAKREQDGGFFKSPPGASLERLVDQLAPHFQTMADEVKKSQAAVLAHRIIKAEDAEAMPETVAQLLALAEAEMKGLMDRTAEALRISADQARGVADQSPLGRALNAILDQSSNLRDAAELSASTTAQHRRQDREGRRGEDFIVDKRQGDVAKNLDALRRIGTDLRALDTIDDTRADRRNQLLEIIDDTIAAESASNRQLTLIRGLAADLLIEDDPLMDEIDELAKAADEAGTILPPNFYDQHGNVRDPGAAQAYLEKRFRHDRQAGLTNGARAALAKANSAPSDAENRLEALAKSIWAEADGQLTEFEAHQMACDQNPDLAAQVYS